MEKLITKKFLRAKSANIWRNTHIFVDVTSTIILSHFDPEIHYGLKVPGINPPFPTLAKPMRSSQVSTIEMNVTANGHISLGIIKVLDLN